MRQNRPIIDAKVDPEPLRQASYDRIRSQHLTPLWEVLHALVPREPSSGCKPHLWRYADVRAPLMESGELITAAEAVRRVLILESRSRAPKA